MDALKSHLLAYLKHTDGFEKQVNNYVDLELPHILFDVFERDPEAYQIMCGRWKSTQQTDLEMVRRVMQAVLELDPQADYTVSYHEWNFELLISDARFLMCEIVDFERIYANIYRGSHVLGLHQPADVTELLELIR